MRLLARPDVRMLLACVAFSAWFSALLFGVLGAAAHLFLAGALVAWPWRATFALARGDDPPAANPPSSRPEPP
jgi:hypothetical protein